MSRLILDSGTINQNFTDQLRRMSKLAAKNRGDLGTAIPSAGYYAKKTGNTMYVYIGNSYGHIIYRVSNKPGEYLDPINNTGDEIFSVTPDLTVSKHSVTRDGHVKETMNMPRKRKPTKAIQDQIDELSSWLPNFDHGPEDFPTLLWRILASMPGGDQAEDMGYKPFNLGWKEADMLGKMLEAIEDKQDVEDLVEGLMADEDEEEEEDDEVGERRVRSGSSEIKVGTRVEGGRKGTEDYDRGIVHKIRGDEAFVGWESGVSTWSPIDTLRPIRGR